MDAVEKRARSMPAEYRYKAKVVDERFNGTPAGTVGPMRSKPNSFGDVSPLCFGWFGEVNSAFDNLSLRRPNWGRIVTAPL